MGKKKTNTLKKIRVNKYICVRLQGEEGNNRGKKNCMVGIYYESSYIYTLHIEEVDMNKRSNVSLIYKGV